MFYIDLINTCKYIKNQSSGIFIQEFCNANPCKTGPIYCHADLLNHKLLNLVIYNYIYFSEIDFATCIHDEVQITGTCN